MPLFFEVVHDLFLFLKETLFGGKRNVDTTVRPLLLPNLNQSRVHDAMTPVLTLPESVRTPNELLAGYSRGYVATPNAKVFMRPVWAFDTVITELSFGTEVSLLGFEGRFVLVESGSIRGWVLKDDVSNQELDVLPELAPGVVYDANHEATIRIRQCINDAFFASDLFLPLQPQEYVMYVLYRQHRTLPLVKDRPRIVGKWHSMFKGTLGVTIGLDPRAGSIVEGLALSSEPFLGLVTAVHANEAIVIESVGRLCEGEFQRETFPKALWRDMQPVFIQF